VKIFSPKIFLRWISHFKKLIYNIWAFFFFNFSMWLFLLNGRHFTHSKDPKWGYSIRNPQLLIKPHDKMTRLEYYWLLHHTTTAVIFILTVAFIIITAIVEEKEEKKYKKYYSENLFLEIFFLNVFDVFWRVFFFSELILCRDISENLFYKTLYNMICILKSLI